MSESEFEMELQRRLERLREQNLARSLHEVNSSQGPEIRVGEETLLNFASNDYLGLASHPALKEAAMAAIRDYGVGAGASRLMSGTMTPHQRLEALLARFKGSEAALVFSSGYAAAVGMISALVDHRDIIVLDKRVHASMVDAARLSGARMRIYRHNDLSSLEGILVWAEERKQGNDSDRSPRVLIVTESVFSMDGDRSDLAGLVALKERYGAWLMVDEAHAIGLFGSQGGGLANAAGVASRIEIQMGTLSKALGVSGGYICGSRTLIDYLIHRARSFVYSTAPSPMVCAAAEAAVDLVRSPPGELLRGHVWERTRELAAGLRRILGQNEDRKEPEPGTPFVPAEAGQSPIIPLMVGGEEQALAWGRFLRGHGVYAPAIRFPTVPRGRARLRFTVTAGHTREQVDRLAAIVEEAHRDLKP